MSFEGWFENQIRSRFHKDNEYAANALEDLASVVMGGRTEARRSGKPVQSALEEICHYYKVPFPENAKAASGEPLEETLDRLLRPSGVMRRRVTLTGQWWKNASGAFLCEARTGGFAAVLPKAGGYRYYDYAAGSSVKVNAQTAETLNRDAVCFYRPLPKGQVSPRALFRFMLGSIETGDAVMMIAFTLAATLLGMFLPRITQLLFSDIIPSGREILGASVGVLLVGAAISKMLVSVLQSLMRARLSAKLDVAMKSAVMSRVINLPPAFFKDYSAGEMAGRIEALSGVAFLLCEITFGALLTTLLSLLYIVQIAGLTPALAPAAAAAALLQAAAMMMNIIVTVQTMRRRLEAGTKVSGVVYALFSGIQKIKLAACEKRAFARWAVHYKKRAEATYNAPFLAVGQAVSAAAVPAGLLIIYIAAAGAGIDTAEYISFMAAYGLLSGSILALSALVPVLGQIKPLLEMGEPILSARLEVSEDKPVVRSLSGSIEINNVSFRYSEGSPMILNNLSLKIGRGQYIAIVGKTGCGKSTLFRLLLGFENPLRGAIYYDGKDISKIDLRSLRRQIGVVMQNGSLFQGDIYSNIVISAPHLTVRDAWEAAETAGIADAIRDMPMGMRTMISEGAGGISGGQKQRIMIARAIAPKPKILFFDEATSALDNVTQKQVSDALAALKSTRIVIAHRLSTIKQCDRVIVLDSGHVTEDGTYEELIGRNGFFAELVRRQQVGADAG
jgi:NHLM bacteriocin system ABC transporter ATP-binding protein